ncbi:polysialyltransferase family glycosyltransferase [Marinilactibacillus kalidii]|uniref:polysialyltransferase family glycosyltransferase n=1 Tax=Marinilactibacillus kalidii TaxID=2820274 RepID=UPI001ABDC652|nr:polysialyltransferase family glycosyltransferase [Marinilactibacillus kalidii]
MNAFIAWTPLHLINIVNTIVNYYDDIENDLYIYNEFEGAEKLYDRAINIDIFENVYLIKHNQINKPIIKNANLLFNLNGYKLTKYSYENIFVQGDNYFAKLLYAFIKSKNKQVALNYIEDGIGAYVESNIFDLNAKKNKLVKIINTKSIYRATFCKYFVYEPSLVQSKEQNNYVKLPKLKLGTKAYEVILFLFEDELKDAKNSKNTNFIFLDQPFQADGSKINEYEVFNIVKSAIKKESELIVKLHPRSSKNKYGEISVINTDLPWELYCLTNQANEATIISMASSAAFTPSMMFDMPIPVIYLAEIIKTEFFSNHFDDSSSSWLENAINLGALMSSRLPDEIKVPKTVNEFKKLIK